MKVFVFVCEWVWSCEEEIDYVIKYNIFVLINYDLFYFIDQNLWGRVNECGILEDLYVVLLEDVFDLINVLEEILDIVDEIILMFDKGILV